MINLRGQLSLIACSVCIARVCIAWLQQSDNRVLPLAYRIFSAHALFEYQKIDRTLFALHT